jgi:hypothetical protein
MKAPLLSRVDKMVLGVAVWLCTLPIAFAVFAFLGWQAGLTTAVGLLLVVALLCWAWCGFHFWRSRQS